MLRSRLKLPARKRRFKRVRPFDGLRAKAFPAQGRAAQLALETQKGAPEGTPLKTGTNTVVSVEKI